MCSTTADFSHALRNIFHPITVDSVMRANSTGKVEFFGRYIDGYHASAEAIIIAETAVASLIDPGLTLAAAYLMFILVLMFRPEGLFGRK